ncbi:EAL domain-containing protein [Dasania marina]|uniref:bifunctional diguanylate cyclase/phosphodiesterase n=1 Tax=Dasania marina TaxID=471499 RepID=UPI0030DB73C4|tara:strand:+ start:2336 stop:4948 length:2613 start_codon:yes stop_codon:yes gene_type:complete
MDYILQGMNKMAVSQEILIKRLGATSFVILASSIIFVVMIVVWAGHKINEIAIQKASTSLESLIVQDSKKLKVAVNDYAWWDGLIENIIENKNEEWIGLHFSKYLAETYSVERVIVLDLSLEPIYQELNGVVQLNKVPDGVIEQLKPTIDLVKQTGWVEPESKITYIRINNDIYAVGVAAVTPEGFDVEPGYFIDRPVLIYLRNINESVLAEWKRGASLIYLGWENNSNNYTGSVFISPLGVELGSLYFNVNLPSEMLLKDSYPLLILCLFLFLSMWVIISLQFKRAMSSAVSLEVERKTLVALESKEELFRGMAEKAPVLIWITDSKGRVTFVNDKVRGLLSGIEDDCILDSWYKFIHPSDRARLLFWFKNARKNYYEEHVECEFRISPDNNNYRWVSSMGTPHINYEGEVSGYLFAGTDISGKKNAENKIWEQANFDDLTKLPNRNFLMDKISLEVEKARVNGSNIAVIYIDLDDFKKINDTQGHKSGDKLLIEASGRINNCLRSTDISSRLGGDEFVVVILDVVERGVVDNVANRIVEAMKYPFFIDELESRITASLGIAIYPDDGCNSDELLMNSDTAMYSKKSDGKNGYCYFKKIMNDRLVERINIEKELISAIENREFILEYQPIFDIDSKEILGAEALVRWMHPVKGRISPDDFIPVLEETKLICDLGKWVMSESIRQLSVFQKECGYLGYIAINVSSVQFRENRVYEELRSSMEMHCCEPNRIQIEITESLFLTSSNNVIKNLNEIKSMGVKVALDDFGTGYSSLSYLNTFEIDVIKVDRSFITHIPEDTGSRKLVSAILSMALDLNLTVVAEGIETQEQLEFLQEHHCQRGQGYFYSRPLSPDDFLKLIKKNREVISEVLA